MYQIDFLPQRYVQQRADKRRRQWRLAVIVLFGCMMAAASLLQLAQRRKVQDRILKLEPLRAQAASQAEHLERLKSDLRGVRASALCRAYLRHPWTASEYVECVAGAADERIRLTELRLEQQSMATARWPTAVTGGRVTASPAPQLTEAEKDLQAMQERVGGAAPALELKGRAENAAALGGFVRRLGQHPMTSRAEILSMESAPSSAGAWPMAVVFVVKVSVRPATETAALASVGERALP